MIKNSSLDTNGNRTSPDIDLALVIAILETGRTVELPATGYSMFPTLMPGDRVAVKTPVKGVLPDPGSVVVYIETDRLVMHRLLEIKFKKDGSQILITRGDSRSESDEPWSRVQMLGVAVSYKRRDVEYPVKPFIPDRWRYNYNIRLLWLYLKFLAINRILA